MNRIDVYDFDKTLYKRDSTIDFFIFCLKKKKSIIKYIPGIVVLYILNTFRLVNKNKLKEYFFKFLKDFKNVPKLVDEFWDKNKKYINMSIISDSKNKKIVVSASPMFLIEKICISIGIDRVIATNVDETNGKLYSKNCHDIEKLNRLNAKYKKYVIENFYSDSYSDECLARISKNSFYMRNGVVEEWNYNNYSRFFEKMVSLIFKIVMIFIVFVCLFFSYRNYACKNSVVGYNNLVCGIIGIVFLGFIFLLNKYLFKKIKISSKKAKLIVILFSLLAVFLLYYLAKKYWFLTGWDAGSVRDNAYYIANDKLDFVNNGYFSKMQNNIFITIFYSFLIRISNFVGVKDFNSTLLFSNCFLFALTGLFIFLTMMRLTKDNTRISFFSFVIFYLLIGFSPWVLIPYSDSISLFLIIMSYYIFIVSEDSEKHKLLFFLLLIMISIIGYNIKPQILIITISILLYKLFNFDLKKVKKLYTYVYICIPIITYLLFSTLYTGLQNKYFVIDKEMNFGVANYLMWGHNYETRGVFPIDDAKYSSSFNTNAERNKANIEKFVERVKYLKFSGVLELYVDKTLTNFNDGTFAWSKEGNFYKKIYDGGSQALKDFYYSSGKDNWIFKVYCQSIWIIILLFNLLISFKNCDYRVNILKLSLIGIFMFELLFEARARYIFAFSPLFIVLMSYYVFMKENKEIV